MGRRDAIESGRRVRVIVDDAKRPRFKLREMGELCEIELNSGER